MIRPGCQQSSHFSREFKRFHGVPPSEVLAADFSSMSLRDKSCRSETTDVAFGSLKPFVRAHHFTEVITRSTNQTRLLNARLSLPFWRALTFRGRREKQSSASFPLEWK